MRTLKKKKVPGKQAATKARESAKARIMGAAARLFAKKPFNKIGMTEIAKEAGVAHGLAFHYFSSKEKLYEAVTQAAADRLDAIHEASTREGTRDDRLRAFLRIHMKELYRRRVDYVFHSRGGGTPEVQAIWEGSRHNAIVLVLGFYGVSDPSTALVIAVRAWLGYYDELVLAWVQGTVRSEEAVVEMAFQLFPAALKSAALLGASDIPSQT